MRFSISENVLKMCSASSSHKSSINISNVDITMKQSRDIGNSLLLSFDDSRTNERLLRSTLNPLDVLWIIREVYQILQCRHLSHTIQRHRQLNASKITMDFKRVLRSILNPLDILWIIITHKGLSNIPKLDITPKQSQRLLAPMCY